MSLVRPAGPSEGKIGDGVVIHPLRLKRPLSGKDSGRGRKRWEGSDQTLGLNCRGTHHLEGVDWVEVGPTCREREEPERRVETLSVSRGSLRKRVPSLFLSVS